MLTPNDVVTSKVSPVLSELYFPEFRKALLAEMAITFAWTSAEGLAESEGPLLAERIWNRMTLG